MGIFKSFLSTTEGVDNAPLHRLENLSGYHLQANDGEIGKVRQVYFDDERWIVRYFVVRTGSWLSRREVLVTPSVRNMKETCLRTMDLILKNKKGSK